MPKDTNGTARRHQPISMQQAVAAALVTALLGGGIGAGGGITLGGGADVVNSADLQRVETKVDKLDSKVEALDAKLVDLRIALAQRGVTAPSTP